jgi:acetyl esterase/lipase
MLTWSCRLAPEHKFPTYIHDCWDALRWIAKHATELGANPKAGFVIGGASAGGNISAVLGALARDEKLEPPLTGVYLCVPVIFNPSHVPENYKAEYLSWAENDQDPVLRTQGGQRPDAVIQNLQEVVGYDLESRLFDPTYSLEGLKGYPPTYLEIGGMDPLRDDGLIFERMLREENNVPTRLTLHEGFGHMFWMNYPMMNASKNGATTRLDGVRWLLGQSSKT